ncbi:MAG: hypothetical protein JJU01_01475 [Alkalibacterium sp.]|nr:hypothetical protein [Alkalibacterium sp.]
MKKIKKHWKIFTVGLLILIISVLAGLYFFIRLNTYSAMPEATDLLSLETVHREDSWIRVEPDSFTNSIVLYQGGLVEEEAYLPLAVKLSEEGYRVFLPSMPFNLAILNLSIFEDIYNDYEEEGEWWISGHSLGGASASIFAAGNTELLDGIIFLASYPSGNSDLSDTNVPVLSITGSDDEILNRTRYEEASENLPEHTVNEVIEGGNHSNFGYYGFQSGDGTGSISRESQHTELAKLISEFIKENSPKE